MNHSIKSASAALPDPVADDVQTSALVGAVVQQQDPAVGGSYVRNTNTGALVKLDPAPEQE